MRLRVHSPEGTFDWESSAAHFRLGRGDACELRIEGKAAQFASWEHAGFSLGDDGANYVTDFGSSNGTYVDGERINGATPVRVGSIVQLGRAGPRLEVLALSSAAPAAPVAEFARIQAAPAPVPLVSVTPGPRPYTTSKGWPQQNLFVGAAVVLIAVVGFFVTRRGPPAPREPVAGNVDLEKSGKQTSRPDSERDPREDNKPVEPPDKESETPPVPQPTPAPVPVAPPATPDPWMDAKERGMAAYRLIVVEDPKTQATWPLAGAVIVGERTLLTTAGVGAELGKLVEGGFRMKAIRGSQDDGAAISRVRLHAAFQQAGAAEQLYFDMALLDADDRLGDAAPLASPAELAALERGQPLACFSIDHTGEVIDRFQQLQPELHQAKVFTVTSPEAGGPRLLHLRGSFSDNPSGSPIFNEQGHLVALYCEAAPAEAARGGQPIHYAKVIEPKLIELGLSDAENQIWVAPVAAAPVPAKKESAK